jgi:2'-5' RNA ligase
MSAEASGRRLFVAVELPDAWKDALAMLEDEMQRDLAGDSATRDVRVRWARPEGTHLTLKFLGNVATGRLAQIGDALERAMRVASAEAIVLRLGRVGSFSDKHAPSVIWCGVEGDTDGLRAMAARVETWLAAAGFPRERRPFAPHLTLARLPETLPQPVRERIATLTARRLPDNVGPFVVDTVSLMQSHLGPGGARYERLIAVTASPLQS